MKITDTNLSPRAKALLGRMGVEYVSQLPYALQLSPSALPAGWGKKTHEEVLHFLTMETASAKEEKK